MKRREILAGLAGVLAPTFSHPLRAATTVLGPPTPMGTPLKAWIAQPSIVQQQCPLWCWAASASMIFAAHGHPVDQHRIVQRVFGGQVCAPAMNTLLIAQVLSSAWADDNGVDFQANVIAAYDAMNGVNLINNAVITSEISQNRPLLYCNTHHAMVQATVDYFAAPSGPNVYAVGVLDPWPSNPSFHPLSPPEMVPIHMAVMPR